MKCKINFGTTNLCITNTNHNFVFGYHKHKINLGNAPIPVLTFFFVQPAKNDRIPDLTFFFWSPAKNDDRILDLIFFLGHPTRKMIEFPT